MLYFSDIGKDATGWDYEELESGTVIDQSTGELISVDLKRVINDKSGWTQGGIQGQKRMCRIYEVDLNGTDAIDVQIENLQYFFIMADYANAISAKCPQFGLLVHGSEETIGRVRTYLSMYCGNNGRYNLLYRYGSPNDEDNISKCYSLYYFNPKKLSTLLPGRILPLMHIVSPENKAMPENRYAGDVYISDLFAKIDSKLSFTNLETVFKEYSGKEKGKWAKEIQWRNSITELVKLYWCRIFDGIAGTAEHNMTANIKLELADEIKRFVRDRHPYLSVLEELVWFINLYAMVADKELFKYSNNRWTLNKPVMQQCYLDILSYSEGVMQLLENSCQHTFQKSSYLSIRLRWTNKNGQTDLNLLPVAVNRESLIRRYENLSNKAKIELKNDAIYYFETSVVDDVRERKDGGDISKGLLTRYRENRPDWSPKTLREVFSENNPVSADIVVHHYGLSAIKQVVKKNGGFFIVSSPCVELNGDAKQTEFVLYPFIRTGKSSQTMYDSLDITTEYHILYPLGGHERRSVDAADSKKGAHGVDTNVNWRLFDTADLTNWDIKALKCSETVTALKKTKDQYLEQDVKMTSVGDLTEKFYKNISERLNADKKDLWEKIKDTILFFDLKGLNRLQIELFAKFMFSVISDETRNNRRMLIALYFEDFLKQQEFIRLFAIFYDQMRYSSTDSSSIAWKIKGAQIAICSEQEKLKIPEVNIVLNAGNWNSLLKSARQFAYCNLESSQKIISQIKYFADEEKIGAEESLPQFPFDLFLTTDLISERKSADGTTSIHIAENSKCWFLERIGKYLQSDLQGDSFGAKVSNAHFYLFSNVHLESFYQGEQFFHNVAYVQRFAYLVARRILSSDFQHKNYLIFSYEAYSSLLNQYLSEFMKISGVGKIKNIESGIICQGQCENRERLVLPYNWYGINRPDLTEDWGFICLYPVGTTLSTIHSMHNCVENELNIKVSSYNIRDFVMILVSSGDETNGQDDIQLRYWEDNIHLDSASPEQRGMVRLKDQNSDREWEVGYIMIARNKWHDPNTCSDGKYDRPLVHTDSTSTQLNTIFPSKTNKRIEFDWKSMHNHDVCSLYTDDETNSKRLEYLRGCVRYGHIVDGSNHFLYHIDFPKYYDMLQKADEKGTDSKPDYRKWLDEISSKVDKDAFNIVVTPLYSSQQYQSGQSPMLKDLLDCAFTSCAHILRLDLHNVRRTDVRARYGFIGAECQELLNISPSTPINVYYVSDSIATTETLHRGLSMIQMILRDSIPAEHRINLYKGIFVLVNRSSRDTLQPFVKNPDEDYHAFVHLAIPHYNTRNDSCPACERAGKYRVLAQRSAANAFCEEYLRLSIKEKKRSPEEYREWQMESLLKTPRAFIVLRQWLYCNDTKAEKPSENDTDPMWHAQKAVKNFTDKLMERLFHELKKINSYENGQKGMVEKEEAEKQTILYILNKYSIYDLLQQEERKAWSERHLPPYNDWRFQAGKETSSTLDKQLALQFEKVWFDGVLADRIHRRLMCTHDAYKSILLEKELTTPDGATDIAQTKRMIEAYISAELDKAKSPIDRWEVLHSSLKVISRDNLSRHHAIREAVFEILHESAEIMLDNLQSPSEMREFFKVKGKTQSLTEKDAIIDPLLRYQMFSFILRRLSDMQSNYTILKLRDNTIPSVFQKMQELFFNFGKCTDDEKSYQFYCTIPTLDMMLFDYEKTIKLAAMADDEKNKSILIQRTEIQSPF